MCLSGCTKVWSVKSVKKKNNIANVPFERISGVREPENIRSNRVSFSDLGQIPLKRFRKMIEFSKKVGISNRIGLVGNFLNSFENLPERKFETKNYI